MKTGLSLQEMAAELARRNENKRDWIADTEALRITEDARHVTLNTGVPARTTVVLGDTFRSQVAGHYRVPRDYAERIRTDHPALYAETFNTFFREEPARRMVRMLDGRARAFLSDRYRPLDDYDLAQAVLPELLSHPTIRIESTQFTESRFYLKAVFPKIETEVRKGDPVQIGLVISNSEIGGGALQVMPLVYRLVCLNGMIAADYGQRKYHIGKRASAEEAAYELYTDGTRRLDDVAFFAKVKDTVRGVLTQTTLEKIVQGMRDATEQRIKSRDIPAVVEVTAKKFGYGETTKQGILQHLIQGADFTRYGLLNAITRQSQDEADYEVATKLEMDGARVIELPTSDWRQIAEAELRRAA